MLFRSLESVLAQEGIADATGEIWLHCFPRVLGHTFKPVSFWYCHRTDQSLAAIVVEVNNTFGERHGYLIPAETGCDGEIRQSCDKGFHVSPFMDMALTYRFRVAPPGETFSLVIEVADADGPMLTARHLARRVEAR